MKTAGVDRELVELVVRVPAVLSRALEVFARFEGRDVDEVVGTAVGRHMRSQVRRRARMTD